MDNQHISAPGSALITEPSDLDVAISVARQLLDSDQVLPLREALRLLLRALDTEPRPASPSKSYDPLRAPDDNDLIPLPVASELELAGQLLDEASGANIHDHSAMIRTATGLMMRLRSLSDAVASERGAGQ
ncbi:hypothetical protein [Streptomyces sp. NPDC058678]|uniref:hypothetical protein n=1 Tax=Streptomyces sp. NPDC058678 TaxID=3346595 RepID=UPI003668C631